MGNSQGKRQSRNANCEMKQMLELPKTLKHKENKHTALDIETNGKTKIPRGKP